MEKSKQIKEIEDLAKEVLKLNHELGLRKPLVIEFCGTPKSGKTTSINALNTFLKRNGFRTTVIQEMATICPVRNKTDYFFNSWTMLSSLAETIGQLSVRKDSVDIILVDRSIYDALCWFEWLNKNPPNNPYLRQKEYDVFVNFIVGCSMWTSIIDLIYVFKSSPDKALHREYAELLTAKVGSIMNLKVLSQFNKSAEEVKAKYGGKFKRIEEYDTTDFEASVVNYDITKQVLVVLKDILTEKIAYFLDTLTLFLKRGVNKEINLLERHMQFQQRKVIEHTDYLQPIPIAVITNKERNKVLVLKKNDGKTEKSSPEHRKLLLYLGGHVRLEDKNSDCRYNLDIFKNTLHREIREELSESISLPDDFPFIIYTPDNEKSKKHLGICYVVEMDLEFKQFRPSQIEFISKSGTTKSGMVMDIKDIVKSIQEKEEVIESWSEIILSEVFGYSYQQTLF